MCLVRARILKLKLTAVRLRLHLRLRGGDLTTFSGVIVNVKVNEKSSAWALWWKS